MMIIPIEDTFFIRAVIYYLYLAYKVYKNIKNIYVLGMVDDCSDITARRGAKSVFLFQITHLVVNLSNHSLNSFFF